MRIYRIDPFELNADLLVLTCGGKQLSLGPKVVETLLALAERPGEVVPKAQLIDRVWPETFVTESSLTQNIYVLRKAFREYGGGDPIQTAPGEGYRLSRRVENARLETTPSWSVRRTVAACLAIAMLMGAALFAGSTHTDRAKSSSWSSESQRLYLIGRYYWGLRTPQSVARSLSYFTQVVDQSPTDARGYAALADANVTMADYCYGTHAPSVYFARAQQYAAQALALNSNSPEALASIGFIALHQGHVRDALAQFQRSVALNPSYAPAHEWYGIALLRQSQLTNGLSQLKIAWRLDPLSVSTLAWLAATASLQHRYGDAILYSRMALELSPQRLDALATLGEAYAAKGDAKRAAQAFRKYASVNPYYRAQAAAMLARADALAHRMREARAEYAYALAHAGAVQEAQLAAAAASMRDTRTEREAKLRGHDTSAALEDAALFAAENA